MKKINICIGFFFWLVFLAGQGFFSSPCLAEDVYSFDLEEIEKKKLDWGGYAEVKWDHIGFNREGAFYRLNYYDDPRSQLDRLTGTLQLDGNFSAGLTTFKWVLQAYGQQDDVTWNDDTAVFEGYASVKPNANITFDLGKKVFRWGKGYAWNPVGFIDRPKDPNNPEEALEGYIGAGIDLVKSFSGSLQNMALTTVALPVWDDVNEDFGEANHVNFAAKLYFLYRDTDIDLVCYTGDSRSTRYGVDFSKNLATNFEIHGELAHIPDAQQKFLNPGGVLQIRSVPATNYLAGVRYLTENDITIIAEYYHTDEGYSEIELERFYGLVDVAYQDYLLTVSDALLQNAYTVSQSGYARPQIGRNYLYARITQKDPFDLLYLTPGITGIYNIDDRSYSITPEIAYTGFTNWDLRARFSIINGGTYTENGEKQNSTKLELRARYFY